MEPVRVGVIGCADIARRRVLPALASVPETELVAVASRDAGKAERFAEEFGCAAVTGYERLLGRTDIDAVYVPLPAALHAEWVERALRSGRHVLAEKPLTTALERTTGLVGLAASRGLVLMENFMFLHHRQHAQVRRLVAEGAIGELRSMSAAFAIPELPRENIRYDARLGGGALLDVGVHPLRAVQYFLGADVEVLGADLSRDRYGDPARAVDVGGAALLRSAEGVTAQVTFGMEHAYRSVYELWGSEGRIVVDRAFTPPPGHRPAVRVEGPGGVREPEMDADDQCANTARAFARAVRSGGPGPWGAHAVAVATLVDSVRRRAAASPLPAPA